MTVSAVLGRISQIESTFTVLNGDQAAAAASTVSAPGRQAARSSSQASSEFAAALAHVTSTYETRDSRPPAGVLPGPAALDAAAAAVLRPTTTPPGPAREALGEQIVATAEKYLGVPYVWGGESLAEGGLDCSGLVQLVFSEHGIDLPRTARQQMHEGVEVPSLDQARPGDLVVTRGGAHIGIYVGDGQMIHAPRPGRTVEVRPLQEGEITTIRRVKERQ